MDNPIRPHRGPLGWLLGLPGLLWRLVTARPAPQKAPAPGLPDFSVQPKQIEVAPIPVAYQPVPEPRPGHFMLPEPRLPQPTYWPATVALGVVFGVAGFVLVWPISLVGLLLVGLGVGGWIGEVRHERRKQPAK